MLSEIADDAELPVSTVRRIIKDTTSRVHSHAMAMPAALRVYGWGSSSKPPVPGSGTQPALRRIRTCFPW